MVPSISKPEDLSVFRISPKDSNYFAVLIDPITSDVNCTFVIEIYQPRGATPPNTHQFAYEFFYILRGKGRAFSGGKTVEVNTGDFLRIPPGNEHVLENMLDEKLYVLCLMVPNEEFAELIASGEPMQLDAQDLAVLKGMAPAAV